jgi:hypothetical protein
MDDHRQPSPPNQPHPPQNNNDQPPQPSQQAAAPANPVNSILSGLLNIAQCKLFHLISNFLIDRFMRKNLKKKI